MTYNDFLGIVYDTITGLTTTGYTDVIYIEYTLEDLIELNPQTYPQETGKSVFLTPGQLTFESNDRATYTTRIYIAQQIKEDRSDRFGAMSQCIELCSKIVQNLPYSIFPLYPLNITPVLLFDATVEGVYIDLQIRTNLDCYEV